MGSEALGKACVCDDVGCLLEVTPVAGELRACLLTGIQQSRSREAGRCVCLGFLRHPKCWGDTQQGVWLGWRAGLTLSAPGQETPPAGVGIHCTRCHSASRGFQQHGRPGEAAQSHILAVVGIRAALRPDASPFCGWALSGGQLSLRNSQMRAFKAGVPSVTAGSWEPTRAMSGREPLRGEDYPSSCWDWR